MEDVAHLLEVEEGLSSLGAFCKFLPTCLCIILRVSALDRLLRPCLIVRECLGRLICSDQILKVNSPSLVLSHNLMVLGDGSWRGVKWASANHPAA